jgi:predicted deacylase
MKSSIIIKLLLFLTVYVAIYLLLKQSCISNIKSYSFEALNFDKKQPTILFVGSQHGNEPAGSEALHQLIKLLEQTTIQQGKIIIIPCLNPCGKLLNIRFQPHQLLAFTSTDLNRNYPKTQTEDSKCEVSKQLQNVVQNADFIVDMHEGWGFHKLNKQSLGSGLYPSQHQVAKQIAINATNYLNSFIHEETKQFVCEDIPEVEGSLRAYCNLYNKPCILIETTGQSNIQPIEIRTQQHLLLAISILRQLQIIQ